MRKFTIEILTDLSDFYMIMAGGFAVLARISINCIPIIHQTGAPKIPFFIPYDLLGLLNVIENKKNELDLMNYAWGISFIDEDDMFAISLIEGGEIELGQIPINNEMVPKEEVKEEVFGVINDVLSFVKEKIPGFLEDTYFKELENRFDYLTKK